MILKFLYQETVVRMGSKDVKLTKGVPMGFLSSPAVFGIALETLLEMLEKEGITCLLYCYDLAIIGDTQHLLRAKKIIDNFCSMTKFEVSDPKSAVVKLARKNVKQDNPRLWRPLPYLDDYKYLGMIVNRFNNLDAQLRVTRRKVFTVLNRIRFLTGDFSLFKKRLLLKSLVIPHVEQIGPIAM